MRAMAARFQSLIGRLKTVAPAGTTSCQYSFQSLIGRLKTSNSRAARASAPKFQSLIGRLKTLTTIPLCATRPSAFQSLIGRLKTWLTAFSIRTLLKVSIPHR